MLKGIYAFVMKRIDALSKQIEKAQSSAEKANSAAETAQAAAETARQAARDANTNANRKVSSVNGKTGAVELAASDVGAISDTDGSVQNAHLADSAVTTDKLAEAERMTGENVINAIGGYALIDTITAEGGESQITVTSVNGLTDVLLAIVSPSTVTAATVQAYAYFDGDSDKWSYIWLNDAIKADGTSTLSVSILNGYVDILAIPSMVRNQSGGSLRGQRRVRDVKTISSISYVMPSGSTFDAGTIIQVYGRR